MTSSVPINSALKCEQRWRVSLILFFILLIDAPLFTKSDYVKFKMEEFKRVTGNIK